jgi:hemerythrin
LKEHPVTPLQWKDVLFLDLPAMDEPSQQLAALLALASAAGDAALPVVWSQLIAHTHAQFAREDRWMAQTDFASARVHSVQHKVVLQVMREGLIGPDGRHGDLALIRTMTDALGVWFAKHSQSMDAALALHLRKTGYDPALGVLHMPIDAIAA